MHCVSLQHTCFIREITRNNQTSLTRCRSNYYGGKTSKISGFLSVTKIMSYFGGCSYFKQILLSIYFIHVFATINKLRLLSSSAGFSNCINITTNSSNMNIFVYVSWSCILLASVIIKYV